MDTKKIYDENGHGFTRIFSHDKVEKVNPVEYYHNHELNKRITVYRDLLYANNPFLTSLLNEDFFIKNAEDGLAEFFAEKEKIVVHPNFLKLLTTTRKKDQIPLLRGMTLNPDELYSLIIKAYKDFGFLYSTYCFENLPRGLEDKKLPLLIRVKDDETIEKVGDTDLNDRQLKNIMVQRNVVVSHFFEQDDLWHCFFITYNSIAGRENHNNGQPHFHYFSSGFGISKEDFIESMRTGNYRATSVHFDLLDYGNQADAVIRK
jgi:hypothetical protein